MPKCSQRSAFWILTQVTDFTYEWKGVLEVQECTNVAVYPLTYKTKHDKFSLNAENFSVENLWKRHLYIVRIFPK